MENLKGQITFAINCNFMEGTDKHDYKAENGKEMGAKIFSFSETFRLKDIGRNLVNYIKENNMDIKQVKDIGSNVVQSFLNNKTNCTQNTVNSYAASLFKLQNVLNATYKNCNLKWREEVAIPAVQRDKATNRGVNSVMDREDYNKILEYCKENPGQSSYTLQLQNFLGIRIEELAKIKLENIDLQNKTIKIEGKGGKIIVRQIPENKIQLMEEIIQKNYGNGKLFSIEGSSINRFLNRLENRLNLEKHSNHDIRRLIAQELFNKLRKEGYSQKDAVSFVCKWLAHGNKREELLVRSYIKIW